MSDQDLNQAASRERAAETRATRNAALACGAVILLIYVVNSLSVGTEFERADVAIAASFPWLLEGTAITAMFMALPLALWAGRAFPLEPGRWRRSALAHLPVILIFLTLQISLMYGLRHIVWPLAYDRAWASDDGVLDIFIYEGRKQAAAYLGFQAAIWTTRTIEFLRLEAEAARAEARDTRRVTLKCGGRVMRLPAGEFRAAKAAGNYVEARFGEGRHLARLTLTELEALLREAGVDAVRVHRSWLVNREQVKEIAPTGEGDVTITLADGESVPGSRRYRDRLAA